MAFAIPPNTTTTYITYVGGNGYAQYNWIGQPAAFYAEPATPKEEYFATLVTDEDEDA